MPGDTDMTFAKPIKPALSSALTAVAVGAVIAAA